MPIKVNLGSGPDAKPGFLNIDTLNIPDVFNWDLAKGLPPICQEQGVEIFTSSHFYEHLYFHEAEKLTQECYKALIPDGKIRISVPNFKRLVEAYLNTDWDYLGHPSNLAYAPNNQIMEIINYGLYQLTNGANEHKHMWDVGYLIWFLKQKIGFKDAYESNFDPDLDAGGELRTRYSIYVEAVK